MIVIHDCPFCGQSDIKIDEVPSYGYTIFCPECHAHGPICDDIMSTISAWNKAARPLNETHETNHDI